MTIEITGLVDGWETVQLASVHRDTQVQSKVRLNKLLAYLQREGYPVPIRLRNIEMGPASLQVHERAAHAEAEGLLRLGGTKKNGDLQARLDYRLTPDGTHYARSTVQSAIKEHPRGEMFLEVFTRVMSQIKFRKNDELIHGIHSALHLDDREELVTTYIETRDRLEEWQETILKEWRIKEDLELAAAGAVELAVEALEAIHKDIADETHDGTGKNNILWNCERILNLLEMKERMHDSRHLPDKVLTRELDLASNAIEVNGAIYGYLTVPDDEEVDSWFHEAPPRDPDQALY